MTLFRIRQYGTSDWIEISLRAVDGESEELEETLANNVRTSLMVDDLHVQEFVDGEWEDIEE